MGWFCDAYSRVKAENEELKSEVEQLKVEVDDLQMWRHNVLRDAENAKESFEQYNGALQAEVSILRTQVQLYDQIMKGLRINVNLDGKKK